MFKSSNFLCLAVLSAGLLLSACGQSDTAEEKIEIKPAPKLTNDATHYANEAWNLINRVDHLVYAKDIAVLEKEVRTPARALSTEWRINVKMTDSVTEGKYALCRKALTSLEIFARTTLDESSTVKAKQADYERDKAQCKNAIEHPELGNTDPKQKGNAIASMQ
jgi:hypothetical protein